MRDGADHGRVDRRGERDAGLAQARERLVARQAKRVDAELDEVRLHLLGVDRQPGRVPAVGEPSCAGMVVDKPVDMVLERVDTGGGDDPCLTHRSSEEVLLAPGALDRLLRAGEDRAERAAEAFREAQRHRVEEAPEPRGGNAGGDRGVQQAGAVEVRRDPALARRGRDGCELLDRPAPSARRVVRVLTC